MTPVSYSGRPCGGPNHWDACDSCPILRVHRKLREVACSVLQPPGNREFNLFHKDQTRKPRKFKLLPLAEEVIQAPIFKVDPVVP